MKVFVVMGNDFPAAVFTTEQAAQLCCEEESAKNEKRKRDGYGAIYWRVYSFDLQGELGEDVKFSAVAALREAR
ncbi:hypothetical protein [Aquamicrobium defluvii]|uniref:Uncharacterized protein n=1 Tax=Aquamicrobium defluvii TaxID=69279 RepID=A0A4R6YET4_9HYPH|nr:hypothetical protein [Aquamicrobium defluvii]TDR34709.1 hypothetical protein DES43_113140 [Aquamicrobium defluvii]